MTNTDFGFPPYTGEHITPEQLAEFYQPYPDWTSAVSQAFRRRAHCQIVIAGTDVTSMMAPYLISLVITRKLYGAPGAQAVIELDDRDGVVPLPQPGLSVQIRLGWEGRGPRVPLFRHIGKLYDQVFPEMTEERELAIANHQARELHWEDGLKVVFQGSVDDVESGFNRRGGGRRLWVTAISVNNYGLAKEPQSATMGDGSTDIGIIDFMAERAERAGLRLVTQGISNLKRKFWHQDNESFQNLAQRLSDEMGFIVKFEPPGTVQLIARNHPGRGTVEAVWGQNLIAWRIRPYVGRPQWAGTAARFFNNYLGTWRQLFKSIAGSLPFGGASAIAQLPNAAPNAVIAGQINEGNASASFLRRGIGWVIINGEAAAADGGRVLIVGSRRGVDGLYVIDEVEHNYTRAGGFTTRLTLSDPTLSDKVFEAMGWKRPTNKTVNGIPVPDETKFGDQDFSRDPNERAEGEEQRGAGGGGGGGGGGGF